MRIATPRALATVFAVIALALPAHGAPRVLATIKPVHALVAGVMGSVAGNGPDLLIRGAQSEHSYALKPSDGGRIARADIVFEIGPDLETYLDRPLKTLGTPRIVVLENAPGIRLLPARSGGLWEDTPDGPADPHIWLDPGNAKAMTRAIADALSTADPARAALYRANAARQIAALGRLEQRIAAELAPVRHRPYLVFHDAYQYFERRFGLDARGAVTVAPERPIGPRRVSRLHARVMQGDIACVFREPQFPPDLIGTIVENSAARSGVLDPLGATLEPGADLYPKLLLGMAASLSACLAKTH